MKKPIKIKTREILITGSLGGSIILNGMSGIIDEGLRYMVLGFSLIGIVISFIAVKLKAEPWDEMCRQNWREASVKTVNLITISLMLYGLVLLIFKELQPDSHSFVLIMVGIIILTRLVFFLHYERIDCEAEEEVDICQN